MPRGATRPQIVIAGFLVLCASAAWAQDGGKIDLEAAELTAELVGRPVFTIDGQEVGTVADLLLDDAGLPQKLRMRTDRRLGIGARTVEVPSGAFMTLRGAVVLDFPAGDVQFLPEAQDGDEDR